MARGLTLGRLGLALALVAGLPAAAPAAEWGGISPGASTLETMRERYGAPSREMRQKVEGYDTTQWIYDGTRAPTGMKRMTIEFGLLTPGGFRPNVVRYFVLEPKPGVFDRRTIVNGWGFPDYVNTKDKREVLFYKSGLQVFLDDTGEDTLSMHFVMPQPDPPVTK